MDLPTPPQAVAAVAGFLRDRLNDVSDTLAPLWNRPDDAGALSADGQPQTERSVVGAARQLAMVIVGAAAPFAPTSYSRARLIRQMHASGLLTDEHVRRARRLLELDQDASGAPR
jgi:hypothetical protein